MPYSDPQKQREYQRQWVAARRSNWIAENGPCTDCGTWDDLEIDHIDARTKVDHRIWSWSVERRETELAKCVVRCDPCHRRKTVAAGECARGEANGATKITADNVRMIRSSPLSGPALGTLLGVDRTLIWQIRARRIWRHI